MADWILKRKDTGASVRLPQDMRWEDEFSWNKVAQAAPQRTLSGGLVIQQGIKANGSDYVVGRLGMAGLGVFANFARLDGRSRIGNDADALRRTRI